MLGLILGIAAVVVAAVIVVAALLAARDDADKNFSPNPVGCTTQPCPLKTFINIEWVEAEAWCSDTVTVRGTTHNWANGESVAIGVDVQSIRVPGAPGSPGGGVGTSVASFNEAINGDAFSHRWFIVDVLPAQSAGHYVDLWNLNARAEGKISPAPLALHFIPVVPKTAYSVGRAHFDLKAEDYVIHITSDIHFVKGWAGSVVKLGASVAATTGGLLDGKLTWSGYRWMKKDGLTNKYWDGTAWKRLPTGFTLIDANNFAVGFYKTGTTFTCQYGGVWPETFADWNIKAAAKQKKITDWESNIATVWTNKFHIKRKECKSSNAACCRYSTQAAAKFIEETAFVAGRMIIADGNIRSNDSLIFIGETRIAVAAHEFGHHLGNPDEYAGATLDTSLNDDGAANGIDANSIMGQNLTTVKKRHYRTICKHFASMVKTHHGKTYTYEAVP